MSLVLCDNSVTGDIETPVADKETLPIVDKGEGAVELTLADDHSPVVDKTDVFAIASSYGTCLRVIDY